MNDFNAFDVLLPDRCRPRFAHLDLDSMIIVSRIDFDKDLLGAFDSNNRYEAIIQQVQIDAPRCHLEVDGIHITSVPMSLRHDSQKLALCTQVIMGLAVEILQRTHHLVLEHTNPQRKRLVIKVLSNGSFCAYKKLIVSQKKKPIVLFLMGDNNDVYIHATKDIFCADLQGEHEEPS